MLGHLHGKRSGSKIAWANQKVGNRVGVGRSRETGCGGQRPTWRPGVRMWRRYGACRGEPCDGRGQIIVFQVAVSWNLRKGDSHLKHNSLISIISLLTLLTPTRAVSPSHMHPWPPCGSLHFTACLSTPTCPLPCHPSSEWLRLFSSQTFSRINTLTFSTPVILRTHPPMKMEQTECSEMLAYKIQTLGITQKKEYNIQNRAKVWNEE